MLGALQVVTYKVSLTTSLVRSWLIMGGLLAIVTLYLRVNS